MSQYEQNPVSEEMAETLEEQRDKRFEKVRRRYRIAVVVLLVAIILLAIRVGGQPIVLSPDYQIAETEPNAYPSHNNETKLEASQGGGAVAMIYSDQVIYDMATDQVYLSYTNPSSSTASIIIQVIIVAPDGSEYLVAQSGAMNPGYAVDVLDSDMDSNIQLSEGVYNGIMRLLFYNPDTGERAIVNTEIDVEITVR